MSDPEMKPTPAEQQAAQLAASLDAAAEDLERNGSVSSAEVNRALQVLYAELDAEAAAE